MPEALRSFERTCGSKCRFSVFEVDFHSGELRKSGTRIRIQDQPLHVLGILLSRPGEIVTREEFRALLWPANTFVDFEHGLNSAIKRLRHALEDDPDRPRFIETLPRHGYRFIGTLEAKVTATCDVTGVPPAPLDSDLVPVRSPTRQGSRVVERGGSASFSNRERHRFWLVALATLAAVALVAITHGWRQPGARKSDSQHKVMLAVLPLSDLGGGAPAHFIAEGTTEELITQLGRADPKELGVIAHTSVERYKGTQTPISVIGRQLKVDYVLEGSVRTDGARVRIAVQLIKVSDETHIWAEEYDSTFEDQLQLQADVADSVTRVIHGMLTPQGKAG